MDTVVSSAEMFIFAALISAVWAFVWMGSYSEWSHDIPIDMNAERCLETAIRNGVSGCLRCRDGYINVGLICLESLEEVPPVEAGAKFGGAFYVALIITTQFIGLAAEAFFIRRLKWLGCLPRKEFAVVAFALGAELMRMMVADVFVLQDLFGGQAYRILREPILCNYTTTMGGWHGADGNRYCDDPDDIHQFSRYFIAHHRSAFSKNLSACSTFEASSPLLDFGQKSDPWHFQFWAGAGHPRFSRLGWLIGGEFAFFVFVAIFVSEVADILFVIPAALGGWRFKALSLCLELLHLGALCPATLFQHSDCLYYLDNHLGLSLRFVRDITVGFGYCIAVMPFFAIPLVLLGIVAVAVILCCCGLTSVLAALPFIGSVRLMGADARQTMDYRCSNFLLSMRDWSSHFRAPSIDTLLPALTLLTFVPLLLFGMFIGSFVLVGQLWHLGQVPWLQLLLLSDVVIKLVGTIIAETIDWLVRQATTDDEDNWLDGHT
jgi:hypothetical protein